MVSREIKVPLYIQVHAAILQAIRTGEFEQGQMLPAEKDLGAMYDVDRQTVRRSLGLLVAEGLIEKRVGVGSFVKGFPGLSEPSDGVGTIAFLLPRSSNGLDRITEPFNAALFSSIEKCCRAESLHLTYMTAGRIEDLDRLPSDTVGVLAVSCIDEAVINELNRRGVPSVLVNEFRADVTSVMPDSLGGAMEGVAHLLGLGHRVVGFISGLQGYVTSEERREGFIRALRHASLSWHEMPFAEGDWTFDGGYSAMQSLLQRSGPVPTAVFAANDVMAFGAIHAISDSGLSVPRDISVLGFDDIDQCRYSIPPLTTIRVDVELTARVVARNLFGLMQSRSRESYRIIVPTHLVVRDSTAAPGCRRKGS